MKIKPLGANQTQVAFGRGVILFSYETPVACILHDGNGINPTAYRTEKNFSKTTKNHINTWLAGLQAESKPQSFFDNLICNARM